MASSAEDWSLELATYPMTIMLGTGGIFMILLGKWASRVGPRRAIVQGTLWVGLGYGLAVTGIHLHSIYLVYPSMALIAFGASSIYTPVLQTLLEWFPDR